VRVPDKESPDAPRFVRQWVDDLGTAPHSFALCPCSRGDSRGRYNEGNGVTGPSTSTHCGKLLSFPCGLSSGRGWRLAHGRVRTEAATHPEPLPNAGLSGPGSSRRQEDRRLVRDRSSCRKCRRRPPVEDDGGGYQDQKATMAMTGMRQLSQALPPSRKGERRAAGHDNRWHEDEQAGTTIGLFTWATVP